MPTRELRVVITGDAKSLSAALGRSKAELTGFGSSADRIASKLTSAGATMTHNVTLPILAAGAAAVKFDLDFEQSLNHIQSLVGANSREMEGYRQSILQLAPAVGKGPKELADALYFITSSGFKGAQALQILTVSAKASAAGLGETQTVADAVTSAVNAYGSSALSAGKATDILTATVREGKGEPDQLAQAIGRVIAPAQAAGVSFDQVGASIAGLTLDGLDANEAVTSLRGILFTFQKVAGPTAEALHNIGRNAGDIRQEIKDKGLIATLIDLRGEFKGNDAELSKLFPNVRALNGFLALTGQTADKNVGIFQRLAQTNNDTNTAFQKSARTTAFEVTQSWAEIQTDLVMAGAIILPVVASIGHDVAGLVHEFSQLPEGSQKLVVAAAIGVAALGPLTSAAGNVTSAVSTTNKGLEKLAVKIGIASGALGVGIVGAAALAATGIYLLATANSTAGESFNRLADSANAAGDAIRGSSVANLDAKAANLDLREANISLGKAQKRVNDLIHDGKRGTPQYGQALRDLERAQLNQQRAAIRAADAADAQAAAQKKARDAIKSARDQLHTLTEATHRATGDSRLNATAVAAAKDGYDKLIISLDGAAEKAKNGTKAQQETIRHLRIEASATRGLIDALNDVPSQKTIDIFIKTTTTLTHVEDNRLNRGPTDPKKKPKTSWTGTPHLGGDGATWINERGTELLTAPDGTSAMLVKLDPGTRIDRAADSHLGGTVIKVAQNFYGNHPDPRALGSEMAWNLRRLLPHAVA